MSKSTHQGEIICAIIAVVLVVVWLIAYNYGSNNPYMEKIKTQHKNVKSCSKCHSDFN